MNGEEVTLEEGIKFIDECSFQYLNIKKVQIIINLDFFFFICEYLLDLF